jgi:prepilin-type N-terminal cleavage/methylation domain-containing protein
MWPPYDHFRPDVSSRRGFSLIEVLLTVVLISILSTVAYMMMSQSKMAVVDTKLKTDVVRLNQIISLYVADGGSLSGLTTAQEVLNKLKTVRTNADAKRQVGALTGRGVDIRLTARPQNSVEMASTSPRAVWNPTTLRFDIDSTPGASGVADFVLDDDLLAVNYPTETRTRTTMLYNDVNGWVWSAGNYNAAAFLNPVNATLSLQNNLFDPTIPPPTTTTSGGTTSGTTTSGTTTSGTTTSGTTTSGTTTSGTTTSGTTTSGSTTGSTSPTTLPTPAISPSGGTFTVATFPSSISLNSGGSPGGSSSALKYRINSGSWIAYTGAFSINGGDKVEAKNFTLNATLYNDSATDADTFYKLVASFTGTQTPTWSNPGGGPNLQHTISNSTADNVVLSHGDTKLDLGGGQYLDAGVENTLAYKRTNPFSNIPPNTGFTLGELVILNGTTFNDSEATSATLNVPLSLTQPSATSGSIALNFSMVSTSNTSDRLASADTMTLGNPTTNFTVTSGGVTYTLKVSLVTLDSDAGVVTGNTVYVYEGSSARIGLIGKFVSNH